MVETWKPIPGYSYYEVSDLGHVRSIGRWTNNRWHSRTFRHGRLLRPATGSFGHPFVSIGAHRPMYIHELVMLAFVGPRPDGYHTCHFDGDPTNNKLTNLRYDTPTGNGADAIRLGKSCKGEKNAAAKLTEEQVRSIRKSTKSLRKLAAIYKVSCGTICFIRARQTWGWLD